MCHLFRKKNELNHAKESQVKTQMKNFEYLILMSLNYIRKSYLCNIIFNFKHNKLTFSLIQTLIVYTYSPLVHTVLQQTHVIQFDDTVSYFDFTVLSGVKILPGF